MLRRLRLVPRPRRALSGRRRDAARAAIAAVDASSGGGEAPSWYSNGSISFKCTACGRCCTGKGGVVQVNEQEILQLASHLKMGYGEFGVKYLRHSEEHGAFFLRDRDDAAGSCVFLGEDRRCTVYEARPTQCVTYPFWPSVMRSRASWEAERAVCEGVEHPDAEPVDEIEAELKLGAQEVVDSGENYTYQEIVAAAIELADDVVDGAVDPSKRDD